MTYQVECSRCGYEWTTTRQLDRCKKVYKKQRCDGPALVVEVDSET